MKYQDVTEIGGRKVHVVILGLDHSTEESRQVLGMQALPVYLTLQVYYDEFKTFPGIGEILGYEYDSKRNKVLFIVRKRYFNAIPNGEVSMGLEVEFFKEKS